MKVDAAEARVEYYAAMLREAHDAAKEQRAEKGERIAVAETLKYVGEKNGIGEVEE